MLQPSIFRLTNMMSTRLNFIILLVTCIFTTTFVSSLSTDDEALYSENSKLHHLQKRETNKICTSAACQEAAVKLSSYMDESINPCENFYGFACGKALKNASIHDVKDKFVEAKNNVKTQLKTIIEKEINENDPPAFKLVKGFYEACTNEDQIEKNSVKEFLEILQKVGGWPLLVGNKWDESKFDWKEMVYRFRDRGLPFDSLVTLEILRDDRNISRDIIIVTGAEPDRPVRRILFEDYLKYMTDSAVKYFGANREEARAQLQKALSFDVDIIRIQGGSYPQYKTIADLQISHPNVLWSEFIHRMITPYARIQGSDEEVLVIGDGRYFRELHELISRTPKRVVANYMYWYVAEKILNVLGKGYNEPEKKSGEERWSMCLHEAMYKLSFAVDSMYVRKRLDVKEQPAGLEMVADLHEGIKQVLLNATWFDHEEDRELAIEKVAYTREYSPLSSSLFDDEKLNRYYDPLKIYPESYLKSYLSLNLFRFNHKCQRLNHINDITELNHDYGVSYLKAPGAIYEENSIKIPAWIWQKEFLNKPKYVTYGNVGTFLSREMARQFDGDNGYNYDKYGNYKKLFKGKWTDFNYYKQAIQIYADYKGYVAAKYNVNKDSSHSLAYYAYVGLAGLRAAYLAYEAMEKRNGIEPRLPGLESYTPEQLFWLTFANERCDNPSRESILNNFDTTFREFEVVGYLPNIPEVSKVFNCPLGTALNPDKKFKFWGKALSYPYRPQSYYDDHDYEDEDKHFDDEIVFD